MQNTYIKHAHSAQQMYNDGLTEWIVVYLLIKKTGEFINEICW